MSTVTVVVPTRNRRALLPHGLRSILDQRDVEVEVVVVDEASSDGTAAVVEALDDPRVRYVRHDVPLGPAGARNAGLALADSPWVAFCDDDDLWAPTKLRRQLDALEAAPGARWSAVSAVHVDEDLRIIGQRRLAVDADLRVGLLAGDVVPGGGSGVVADTATVRRLGGFDVTQVGTEDWDMWLRLAAHAPCAVVDELLVAYRVAPGALSTRTKVMLAGFDRFAGTHRELVESSGVAPDRGAFLCYLANQAVVDGNRRAAAELFLRTAAVRRSPRDVARAAISLADPSVLVRRGRRWALGQVEPADAAAVEEWLGSVRAGRFADVVRGAG